MTTTKILIASLASVLLLSTIGLSQASASPFFHGGGHFGGGGFGAHFGGGGFGGHLGGGHFGGHFGGGHFGGHGFGWGYPVPVYDACYTRKFIDDDGDLVIRHVCN